MNVALRGVACAALLGVVGCCVTGCGGDDSASASADGSGGAAGSSGSGGGGTAGTAGSLAGGSAGTSGSGGTAGTSGSGGTAGTAGSGGTAGTAGSAGTAGTAGTGGTAGTAGSAGTGGSPVDAGSDGDASLAADVSADVVITDSPAQDVAADVQSSDVVDATVVDTGPDATGPDAGITTCPSTEPTNNTDCTQYRTNLSCDYGDAGDGCFCRTVSAGVLHWVCTGGDSGTPACPHGAVPNGQSCSDGGVSYACRFGTTWCFCNEGGDATANIWQCL